ncbi:uncharacterized protein LOC110811192 [Carica papaya]|uniref:uncharacterized protein LOC110811192 n=1 Tax=Carica papaya TaxID=3649 RepID=UPI000B8D10F5|nr:uncharacterized protein LOC110811192 [Carica papaya]
MALFEALYVRPYRAPTCWTEVGNRHHPIVEYDKGTVEKVFPFKARMRFERRGKISLRFTGPLEIMEHIGPVAYHLALPPQYGALHDGFHIYMLKRYLPNPSHVILCPKSLICSNMAYPEYHVEILDWSEKVLCKKRIPIIKVLW